MLETYSWVTGLHWRPKKQSSPEDKPRREEREVGKGQKVDWTRDSQRRREDGKGRLGRQKTYGRWGGEKKTKVEECLPKEMPTMCFKGYLPAEKLNLTRIKPAGAKADWRQT